MTDPSRGVPGDGELVVDAPVGAPIDRPSRVFSIPLNIAGVVVVGFFLVQQGLLGRPAWVIVVAGVAVLAWLVRSLGPSSSHSGDVVGTIAATVAVVAGSLVVVPTDVLGYVPAVACLAFVVGSPARPLWFGIVLALMSFVIVSIMVLAHAPVSPNLLLGASAALLVAVLLGISRRQFRVGTLRQRELIEQRLRLAEEREHAATLAERSRIARDIHDVLAHSLGGLVLQLDAVDALLESGRTEEAHARVRAARSLAASGLDDARRAVDALRDPETSADLPAALAALVATHHSLGAEAELELSGEPHPLTPEAAGALRRAAQELLSNARRHAPGQPTRLRLAWTRDAATLTASTVLAPGLPVSSPGGGRGLSGLRERVVALGGSAEWGVAGGAFSATAVVPVGAPS